MGEIRLKPLYLSEPVGLGDSQRSACLMLFFPPSHSVNRILSLCLHLIPKIICKCTAAILFSPLFLPLSLPPLSAGVCDGLNIPAGLLCVCVSSVGVQVCALPPALSCVIPDKLLTLGRNDLSLL